MVGKPKKKVSEHKKPRKGHTLERHIGGGNAYGEQEAHEA